MRFDAIYLTLALMVASALLVIAGAWWLWVSVWALLP